MHALQARLASGIRDGTLTEEVAQEAASPMRELKSIFLNAPSPNTLEALDIFLSAPSSSRPRALVFPDLGSIQNDWVATEFVLHYFEGDVLQVYSISPNLLLMDRFRLLMKQLLNPVELVWEPNLICPLVTEIRTSNSLLGNPWHMMADYICSEIKIS